MRRFQKFIRGGGLLVAVLLAVSGFGAAAQGVGAESRLPSVPVQIIGTGQMNAEVMVNFLLRRNPYAIDARKIVRLYIEEAAAENVNHDIAFAQMCLETGYLSFSGMVPREFNNFGGFGAFTGNIPNQFATAQEGVRAQIQHLKAYATNEQMHNPLVDPRYAVMQEKQLIGSAPTVFALTGKWATDKDYGSKIVAIMSALYQSAETARR